ncbi:broad-complex core protein-like isoform X3 [Photinus pyralis]|uniref:broad-complex core protein-like isoform X3 n=1 Tax=Photinus pyralis TaxID=7054 RepID=UPI0012670494|nr:broad-complex core protein-like isoform X3 [Photinus pyralis]
MMSTEQFSLRWNNFHSNLTSGFHDLMQANDMVDVTLAVDGQFLQAHKLVLSICSPLFKQLFKINPCKHPVIILRDVTYENLKDILAFMYLGEVNVLRDNLSTFLRTAELLQVKGLTSDDSSDTSSKKDDKSDTTCDNDMEQDIHQFNTMMASSDLEPISYTPSPQPHSVKRTSQNISGQSKRSKSDQTSTSIIEKQERFDSPIQIEEDGEYMENTNFEPYPCEGEEVSSNREAIKQFLECNNVNVLSTQDSSSQDHARCSTCGKLMRKSSIRRHMFDVHYPTQQLPCDICHKLFKTANSLTTHLITIHRQLKTQRPNLRRESISA